MPDLPTETTTSSCLLLPPYNNCGPLPTANLECDFMVEWVAVTEDWELNVPTISPRLPLRRLQEGLRTMVRIRDGKLRHAVEPKLQVEEELKPSLSTSAVVQAISACPEVGRIWLVQ